MFHKHAFTFSSLMLSLLLIVFYFIFWAGRSYFHFQALVNRKQVSTGRPEDLAWRHSRAHQNDSYERPAKQAAQYRPELEGGGGGT